MKVIMLRIWILKKFFPEYRKMLELVVERGKEIYSLSNVNAEHVLLTETQSGVILELRRNLQEKQTEVDRLSKLLARNGKVRK